MNFENIKTKLTPAWKKITGFTWKIVYDWSFSLASLLAYYLLLSLLPLILAIFSISVLLFGKDAGLQKVLHDRLVQAFPQQDFGQLVDQLQSSLKNQAGWISIVSFIVAVFGGSRLLIGLDDALTIIYRVPERTVIGQNIHAIKMLLAFLIFFPLIIVSSSATAIIKDKEVFYYFISTVLSGIFAFLLLNLIYYFVPNKEMSFKKTWCGSLFGAVGLLLVFLIFPVYVHLFMTNYVGNLGFIIIVLLLFYVLGLILVLGAQINAFFFENIQPLPAGVGDCICRYTDHERVPLTDGNSNSMSTLVSGLDLNENIPS